MTAGSCEFSSCSSTCICLCYRQRDPDWNGLGGTPCHESKTQSGRRRRPFSKQNSPSRTLSLRWKSIHSFMFAALFSIFFCSGRAGAENAHSLHRRVRLDELLFDRREPPIPPMRLKTDHESVLNRRDNSVEPPSLESSRDETTRQLQIPLPSPFDANLGNNFTSSSCPAFFQNFLNNESFRNCLPLSLLLQVCDRDYIFVINSILIPATTDFQWILRNHTLSRPAHRNSRRHLPCRLPTMFNGHGHLSSANTIERELWRRPADAESNGRTSIQWFHGLSAVVSCRLFERHWRQLLLCGCCHQHIVANEQFHLLSPPWCAASWWHSASLQHMLTKHHGRLRYLCQRQQSTVKQRLHSGSAAS